MIVLPVHNGCCRLLFTKRSPYNLFRSSCSRCNVVWVGSFPAVSPISLFVFCFFLSCVLICFELEAKYSYQASTFNIVFCLLNSVLCSTDYGLAILLRKATLLPITHLNSFVRSLIFKLSIRTYIFSIN